MRFILSRALRSLFIASKIAITECKKISLPVVKNYTFNALTLSNIAVVSNAVAEAKKKNDSELSFLNEVRKACIKNDDALVELMNVLSECLHEISKEYQANIEKQIHIIALCTELGPVGEHWDELTKYRIQGTELREELTKYEVLVQKVGQMAYNQAVTSLLSGIEDAMDLLEVHYNKLEKTVTKLAKDNYYWETKLLYANRDSILHGLK